MEVNRQNIGQEYAEARLWWAASEESQDSSVVDNNEYNLMGQLCSTRKPTLLWVGGWHITSPILMIQGIARSAFNSSVSAIYTASDGFIDRKTSDSTALDVTAIPMFPSTHGINPSNLTFPLPKKKTGRFGGISWYTIYHHLHATTPCWASNALLGSFFKVRYELRRGSGAARVKIQENAIVFAQPIT